MRAGSRRWAVLLAVCLAAVAVVGVLGVRSWSGPSWSAAPEASSVVVVERLLAPCLEASDAVCLGDALTEASLSFGPAAAFSTLDGMRSRFPSVAMLCHEPGHQAGAAVFARVGSLPEALQFSDPVCQSAFQHGVFDAWTRTLPGPGDGRDTEFAMAAPVCEAAPAGDARYLCFDGFGHAAWLTSGGRGSRSMAEAARVCGFAVSEDGRLGCMAGVVMQRFAPVIAAEGDRVEPVSELARACAEVPAQSWAESSAVTYEGSPLTARSACRLAAYYPFGVELSALPDVERVPAYLELCGSLGVHGADALSDRDVSECVGELGYGLWYAYGLDSSAASRACSALPEDLVSQCVAKVEQTARANG